MGRPFLLIEHLSKMQFVLDALKSKGLAVYVASCEPLDESIIPKSRQIITDTHHPTKLVADVVTFMEANNIAFGGVGTFYEQVVTQTAVLARALGLVGSEPGATFRSSSNKLLMRRFCRVAGIPTPKITVMTELSAENLAKATQKIGHPCVVKPIFGGIAMPYAK